MRIEHTGYMVEDPPAVAAWYVEHLGFEIVRKMDEQPYTHFIAVENVMLEIYNNPQAEVPDYGAMDPLVLHIGFEVTGDIEAEKARLVEAGARVQRDTFVTAAGDELVMLRDPWGFAIQLCKRASVML